MVVQMETDAKEDQAKLDDCCWSGCGVATNLYSNVRKQLIGLAGGVRKVVSNESVNGSIDGSTDETFNKS